MFCQKCGKDIGDSDYCPHCGTKNGEREKEVINTRSPGVAAILSFFIPGLGQIYNGQLTDGIGAMVCIGIFLVMIPVFHVWAILLLLAFWIWCIRNAYVGPSRA
jgi:TM2 domain-containing membrane protein YozV